MEDPLEKLISEVRRGQNCIQGVFLNLRNLLNIFHFGLLCHVATLDLNVATSKTKPRSRRDVGSQRRDIGISTPWNVATLDFNVATSVSPLSGMSQRWIQTSRRWIYTLSVTSHTNASPTPLSRGSITT